MRKALVRRAVIAPDKFKGSLSAPEAAAAIERGVLLAAPETLTTVVPMADGGEGTVDAFVASGWQRVVRTVRGPLGAPVAAGFALAGADAVIEVAAASGLAPPGVERDSLRASTYGTGELVRAALDLGARRIVIAAGGSATTDGGAGLLCALGLRLRDRAGFELAPGGAALAELAGVEQAELDPRLRETTLLVAADVEHPLAGPGGAAAVFGPQKGASPADVRTLDAALVHFADVSARALGTDPRDEPGSGAAGGLGYGLRAYLGAQLRSGARLVAELRGLPAALDGAAWCFTGEGSIDEQTLGGKTVVGVAALAREANVLAVAFGGRVTSAAERLLAVDGTIVVPLADGPASLAEALAEAGALLERAAARTVRLLVHRG